MAGTKRTASHRGRQPVVHDNDEEIEIYDPATPTPDAGIEQEENLDDDDHEEGPSIREHLRETPSKHRFHELAVRYKELESEFAQLKKKINEITIERDKAIAHCEHARREQGTMAIRLLALQLGGRDVSAPTVEAHIQKSAKMPDAPMLNDGKLVRFETWETTIRQKLEANADHYPLPVHRLLYVQSRCEGKAQLHIAPRMSPSATLPYTDSDDVIAHLRTVFSNPNRKAEAYTAYHKLKMKPKDNYADFLAEFMQLAEEAGVVEENRKRDLYSKLPYLLQSQVI